MQINCLIIAIGWAERPEASMKYEEPLTKSSTVEWDGRCLSMVPVFFHLRLQKTLVALWVIIITFPIVKAYKNKSAAMCLAVQLFRYCRSFLAWVALKQPVLQVSTRVIENIVSFNRIELYDLLHLQAKQWMNEWMNEWKQYKLTLVSSREFPR